LVALMFTMCISVQFFILCSANATLIYSLNKPNDRLTESGPYGVVTVNLTSPTTATVQFDSATGFLFGKQFAMNTGATAATAEGFTSSTDQQMSEFGKFKYRLDGTDKLSFVLIYLTGSWTEERQVLYGNSSDWFAAAHIRPDSGETGFAAAGAIVPTPLPGALLLLGPGLLGLAALRRKILR
jgi:hypothetical protein